MISTKLQFIASLILSAATLPAMAAPQYSMKFLGNFYGTDINNAGDVVGISGPGADGIALYSGGGLSYIGAGRGATAYGMNDVGQIVGQTRDNKAFIYTSGSFNVFGAANSKANAINNAGQVAGQMISDGEFHAFAYSGGTTTDLTPSGFGIATGINSQGQIAGGASMNDDGTTPVIFANGTITDVGGGAPGNDYASRRAIDINDNGAVLLAVHENFSWSDRAYVYQNGVTTAIGTSKNTFAVDINNSGLVVGMYASNEPFLWKNGTMYDLDMRNISGLGEWSINAIIGINDSDQIAVNACRGFSADCGTLLLSTVTAVPEPSTYAMMVGGLGLLGFAARRRRPAAQA